ncbi:MAG: P-II family nitrogen regulator [Bacilli bacterium]|jgi:nitrogen regulatory protein PII
MEKHEHELIICIVNNGFTDLVMDAARSQGARGGTIFHGRGTSNPDMERFFGISISPEKEIVIILVLKDIKELVLKAINKAAGFETNGKGIAFSMPVSDVVGV